MMLGRIRGRLGASFVALVAVAAIAVLGIVSTASAKPTATGKYVLGVSNTLVGNGWREEMICAVKAQALASGKVSKVIVANRNGGPAEQIADIRNLISAGANAIIINPSSASALNAVVAQAAARGVKVISVDQRITAPQAYNVTNDQVAYGRLGATWLFKKLGGKGNVVEMRGAAGASADTDRHKGFQQALKKYPNIKVVKSVYTNWTPSTASQQALQLLQSGTKIDGIWTSGIDYGVVNAFKTAGKKLVPVVGANNEGFVSQLLTTKGLKGVAVTNPATIGGVGTAIALDVLAGEKPAKVTKLTPTAISNTTSSGKATLKSLNNPKLGVYDPVQLSLKPYTTYTADQLYSCAGP